MLEQALKLVAAPGQDALLPGHRAEDAGPLRRGARASARRGRAVSARSRRAQRDRPRAISSSAASTRRSPSFRRCAGGRSGGSAGALQPDAVLSGPGRRGRGRSASGRSTRASRPTNRRRRSPARTGSSRRTTTTSGSRFTSTRATGRGRRGATARKRYTERASWTPAPARMPSANPAKRIHDVFDLPCVIPIVPRRSSRAVRRAGPVVSFADVTAQAGIRFVHNNGAFGKKYLPETMGSGVAVLRRRRRRLAGLCCSSTRRTGRAGPARDRCRRCIATAHNGTFTDITRGSGLDVELYGIGAAAADFDNDGRDRHLRHRARRQPAVPEPRRRPVRGRHREGRRRRRRVFDERAVVRLRQRRQARSVRRALRRLGRSTGSVLHARRQDQVVLHAGVVQGQSPSLYRNRGDGTFENVTKQAGLFDTGVERARRRDARLRRRRLGWICSSPTTPQPNRLYRNKGNGTFEDVARQRRRGVQRGGRRARRHGRRRRRLRRLGTAQPDHRQLLERDDGALSQRGQRAVHRRCAEVGDRPGVAADADLRLLLLRLRPRRPIRTSSPRTDTWPTTSSTVQSRVTYAQRPHLFRNVGASSSRR